MGRFSPLWNAIVAEFRLPDTTKRQKSRVAALYADYHALGATADELRVRRKRMEDQMGKRFVTAESLAKHWSRFAEPERTLIPGQPSKAEQAAMEAQWAADREAARSKT